VAPQNRTIATPAWVADRPASSSRVRRRLGPDDWFRHATLLPAIVLLLLLTVYPVINLLLMSVSNIEFSHGEQHWSFTGLANLQRLFGDWLFAATLRNTLIFVAVSVVVELLLGFALAVIVSGVPRAKGLVRTLMILPILVPPVAIGSMWKLMYNFDFGIFNQVLDAFGLPPVGWLSDSRLALGSVIAVDIWHWTPFMFLILFAGVEGLPREVMEAARVDGASIWQTVAKVIVPIMRPALTIAFLFRSIFAFKVFDEIFLLTSGGPGTATDVVSLHLFKVFFEQNNLGYGALLSIVIILAIVTFLLTARQFTALAR
jgi:multiple sugar transport system permease protein